MIVTVSFFAFCGEGNRDLDDSVDARKIEAQTHNGIIEVTIPLPAKAKKETVTITPTTT